MPCGSKGTNSGEMVSPTRNSPFIFWLSKCVLFSKIEYPTSTFELPPDGSTTVTVNASSFMPF